MQDFHYCLQVQLPSTFFWTINAYIWVAVTIMCILCKYHGIYIFSIHNSIINWSMPGLWMNKTYTNPKEIRKLFKAKTQQYETKTTYVLRE